MSRINSTSRKYAILFFGSVLFHILGTWSLPLIDRDEPRFAEASREMIERGDYVVPYFNNQLRLDKPPLTYWAQTLSYRIFGENDFAARFPSAVAAALTALVIFAWGRRIADEKLAWWAAVIFTLSLQTFVHAKAAVADMWLVLFMTMAHWAGYETLQGPTLNAQRSTPNSNETDTKQKVWWWLMFYLSLAFGFLAKGPIAWAPLLTIFITMNFMRKWEAVRRFKFAFGLLLMLGTISLWGVPALVQTHGKFFTIGIGRHVIGRSIATMEGHGADSFVMYLLLLPFYFVTVFISFFPWSLKLPSLIGKLWKAGRDDLGWSAIDTYLTAGIAVIFFIFTVIKTKLPHYTLPAFPLLALLLARHWRGAALFQRSQSMAGNRHSMFTAIAVTTACVWIAIALFVPPMVARFFPAYQLFKQSRPSLEPDMQFASVEFEEPSLVWYFRARVKSFLLPLTRRRAGEFMTAPGPRFTVLPTPVAGALFAQRPSNWQMFSAEGVNIAKGKRVDLTLALKTDKRD